MRNLVMLFSILLTCMFANSQQIAKSLTAANGTFIGFYEYKPTNYSSTSAKKYPLIVFMHGMGERGNGTTDLPLIKRNGITKNISAGHNMTFTWNGKTETFLVLSPQLDARYSSWPSFYADEMIKYAKANLNIDPDRIIITGLSLGGGGTWRYAAENATFTNNIAAIGVSCGTYQSVDYGNIARGNLPVWAFHAENDDRVPVSATYNAVDAINASHPAVVPYVTIWPTGGHTIWTRVYDTTYAWQNPNIYEWFLAQNRSLAPNKRPVANAGGIVNHPSPSTPLSLNASQSTDADGSLVRFIWRQISGPSASVIAAPVSTNGVSAVTGLVAGKYKYELKVVDDRADWKSDTLTVNVAAGSALPNAAPIAKAGVDTTIMLPASSVTLNGSASTDSDGSISSYKWIQVTGPAAIITSASAASTTVTGLVQGVYTFELTVADNGGATGADQVIITVNAAQPNTAPSANAGPNVTITLPTSTIKLSGTASDADGSIASYKWKKLSGPATFAFANETSASTDVINLIEGTYVFRFTVTDGGGLSSYDDVAVYVKQGVALAKAPVAAAGLNLTLNQPANTTTLNGAASYDQDGSIVSYAWKKLSGPASFSIETPGGVSTLVSGLVEGTYVFRLTVKDNAGLSSYDDIAVYVKAQAPASVTQPLAAQPAEVKTQNASNDNLAAYPNPARANLNVQLSGAENGRVVVNVYDISGRMISKISMLKSQQVMTQQVDVSRLNPGFYNIEAIVNGKVKLATRFVKQ